MREAQARAGQAINRLAMQCLPSFLRSSACDAVVEIPVYGLKNSLNVANVVAVALFDVVHGRSKSVECLQLHEFVTSKASTRIGLPYRTTHIIPQHILGRFGIYMQF